MSLPEFSTQSFLFSTAALSSSLFPEMDRYRLFARLVYPRLVKVRPQLAASYSAEDGRPAIEPLLLLGVSILQFLDGEPDRAAVEMLRYHAGWSFALNRQLGDPVFHPTTLVNFRQRLLAHNLSAVGFQAILDGLVEAGLVARQTRQRLDSMQMFARLSRMSRLECVRETLRLALEELEIATAGLPRPDWWPLLWERYVETKLDYRVEVTVLRQKMNAAGIDAKQVLCWVPQLSDSAAGRGEQLRLLERVWSEHFETNPSGELQQLEPNRREQFKIRRTLTRNGQAKAKARIARNTSVIKFKWPKPPLTPRWPKTNRRLISSRPLRCSQPLPVMMPDCR
jgi:hypothetical protein